MTEWTELGQRWGVEPGYFDVTGRWRQADEATLRRIAEALSAEGNSPVSLERPALSPEPSYQGDGRKAWTLAVQLYGVRSRRNWGNGDFTYHGHLLESI